jgi:hypothetical protein
MSFADRGDAFSTFSRVLELEGKLTKTNQTVNTILEENKILKQELNDAIFAINLLEKQMAGIRAKVANIGKDANPPLTSTKSLECL